MASKVVSPHAPPMPPVPIVAPSPVPGTPTGVSPAGVVAPFGNASLYVGDLDPSVTERELFDVFSTMGTILSIRVCRDMVRRVSLGYGYVNFGSYQEASRALEHLNFTPVNGKPIRIMFSQRDPSIRKSGYGNVFIKNLDSTIDNKMLLEVFASFGTVLSCKVAIDNNGQSKGYGFIQFEKEEAASKSIEQLNGMLLNGRLVYVGHFVRRQEREKVNGSVKFTNVYVKNFSETVTDDDLRNIFGKYGPITSAVVMKDTNGNSKCFGFVNFQNADDAAAAVEKLNGSTLNDDRVLYVGRAQKKSEREAELKAKFEQERNDRLEKLQAANLYIKNLEDSIDDAKLKELFTEFGTITSCKVMVDSHGLSKGSGFVAFSSPDEASHAVQEMSGKMVGKKPLYVAVAQRKEERKARLQAQFAQLRNPGVVAPPMQSGLPAYPGAARIPPPMYFGQGGPNVIHPQSPGYGYPQQMMHRPGVNPNYMVPYHMQRQGQPRMGGIRRGGGSQQMQYHNHQQRNGNHSRYMHGVRNGFDPSIMPPGMMGQMMPVPLDANGMPMSPIDAARFQPVPVNTLTSALASASPENRRLMLGDQLYPLVEQLERENAGKVTGMLLEMDQNEVLHLIESPDALKKKVGEAMDVLVRVHGASSDAADQLGALSLNE